MRESRKDGQASTEITPEMLRAGAEVLYHHFGDVLPYESSLGLVAASLVWEAMAEVACEAGRRVVDPA